MSGIFKVILEAVLGALARAFGDWRKDRDRIQTHEGLGRKQVEDAQKGKILDAIKDRKQIEDDIARLDDDAVLAELRAQRAANPKG